MGLMDGRKGLVFGIANDRSIACHIARSLVAEGASCGFPYLPGEKNEDGHAFFCSANGVWLTDHVPVEYIEFPS